MPMQHTLPGTPPLEREGEPTQQADIPLGSLTRAQADQYVTELTRARITATVAQCDMEIAEWNKKSAADHDLKIYLDSARAAEKAIPYTDKKDPNHAANEARRVGLLEQIKLWEAWQLTWGNSGTYITAIQKRRDATMTYLNSMPPKPTTVVGYPIPTPPQVAFAEASVNWPPPHVDPAALVPDET